MISLVINTIVKCIINLNQMSNLRLLFTIFKSTFWVFSIWIVLLSFTVGSAQDLKLMTYNIRLDVASDGENAWPYRKEFFGQQVVFYDPDIIGFQEVLPDQLVDLKVLLPTYTAIGLGRELGNQGESSNIFYKTDRFKLKDSGTFWLSETPDKVSRGWDAACHRVCTYVHLYDKNLKKSFWVFNTHLDHIGVEARENGIKLIMERIQKLNKDKLPVIFMGDLNTEPNDKIMEIIRTQMEDTRDVSLHKPFGPVGTFNGFKHDAPVLKRIDYIFISKKHPFKVQKYAVLSDAINMKYPSDHLAVLAVLSK